MPQLTFRIRRFQPGRGDTGWQDFSVESSPGMTILDGLHHIREHQDGSLAWRHSCRMGVCGSCGLIVNGEPRLACNTQVESLTGSRISLEPLWNFPVAKDLVPDLSSLFEKHSAVAPYLVRDDSEDDGSDGRELAQSPAELDQFLQFTSCIKCGVCMAACPTLASDPDFLGPMPLTAAYRYNADSRDSGFDARKTKLAGRHGMSHCHYAAECSRACPKGVDPARAIQLLKRDLVLDLLGVRRREPAPPVDGRAPRTRDGLQAPPFTVPSPPENPDE